VRRPGFFLELIPEDLVAVGALIRVGNGGVINAFESGVGQLKHRVVRQQEAAGAQHVLEVGERELLLEDVVVDEDVRGDHEIELFVAGQFKMLVNGVEVDGIDALHVLRTHTDSAALQVLELRGQRGRLHRGADIAAKVLPEGDDFLVPSGAGIADEFDAVRLPEIRALARVLQIGVPDVVVNNAGVFIVKPIAETTRDDFTRTIATNLTAPFLVARAVLPKMVERGSGHIVSVGSISDYIGFPGSSAYAASKFGLRGMHEVIRAETARTRIRTTLVSPGPVDTDLWDEVDPDSKPGFTKRKDMMRAEDVAAAVMFAVTAPERLNVTEIRLLPTGYTPRG